MHSNWSVSEEQAVSILDTKEQVMEWMLDIQLGRRNLSPIQRIAVAEKYRPIYEKMAKENLSTGGRNGGLTTQNKPLVNLPNPSTSVNTSEKLAQIAGVSEKTYRMGAKVLNSDNEDVKNRVLSGETSISAGYKEHSTLIQSRCFADPAFNICQNDSFYQLSANLPNLTIS